MSINTENINYEDFKNICRTCMSRCVDKFVLDYVISNVFYKLTNIRFETYDELPQQICFNCYGKIIEIHKFTLQCKRTHSTLKKILNSFKNKRVNDEEDISEDNNRVIQTEEEIIIDEQEIHSNGARNLNSTNDDANNELELEVTPDIVENISYESKEDLIPETREINNHEFINCSENVSEEESNSNTNLNDLNEDTNSSNANDSGNIDPLKINERPFKCEQCSKSFKKAVTLRIHMHIHSDERPYKCEQCSKSYKEKSTLKTHMRMHSGERPYKCPQCSKSFTQSSHLLTHARSHSGERPFVCTQCSKSFNTSGNLKQHIRTHTGERRYKCEQCSKSFYVSDKLKIHMRTHTGERPYKCDLCSKAFAARSKLKRHMRTHNKI